MAKYSSTVNYKITTTLDASGVTKLQAELSRIESQIRMMQAKGIGLNNKQALADIKQIQTALTSAFNPSLGMMNTKKLMTGLTANGRSLNDVFNTLGTRSASAMTQLSGQISKIDTGMKSVSKTTDKVLNTLGNTVRWGVIASGFQYVLNSAHSAVQYMADLDESLTNIRLVTDESKDSMREFAKYANDAAKSLGSTTVAYTDAALIYAQQGYGLSDQKTLANYTLMTANATGQDTAEVSEQMTSMINGFQLSVGEVGQALDVLAKVANVSAADLEELATATSKVASTANTLGVTQEQLTAQIATIVSVTREAPENVGNALKTIYARFGDLSLGETLEDGMDLGKVSSTLEKIGVQVLDASGGMRDMGLIMEDLMAVWDTLDTAQKQGAAVTLAGKYQYNRLMALMENSDMYESYYNDAMNSEGTLDTMQSEYMESLEGKANALKASFEGLLTTMFDQDDFGVIIEGLTEIVDKFTTLTEAIDGGGQMMLAFGAIATKVFSGSIGRSLGSFIENRQMQALANQNVMQAAQVARDQFAGKGVNVNDSRVRGFANDSARINQYAPNMSDEQIARSNDLLKQRETALTSLIEKEKIHKQDLTVLRAAYLAADVSQEALAQGEVEFLRRLEASDIKLTDYNGDIADLREKLTNLRSSFHSLGAALEQTIAEDDVAAWDRFKNIAISLEKQVEKMAPAFKAVRMSEEQVKAITEALKKIQDEQITTLEQLERELGQTDIKLDQLVEGLNKTSQALKKNVEDFDKAEAELRNLEISYDATRDAVKRLEAQLKTQTMATHLTNIASGAMNAVFAFQSLKNIGSIINNDDLSQAEKIEQVIMNLSMVLAMGVPLFTGAGQALKGLTVQLQAYAVAQGISNLQTDENIKNKALEIAAQNLSVEETNEAVVAKLREAAVGKTITAQKAAEIAATYGLSEAEVMAAASANGLTIATSSLSTAITGLLVKMAPFLAIGAAVAAAVAGAYALYRAYTKDARAAEEAKETAKELKQVYSDLNTEVSELKSNIENYKDAKAALSDLKKGTEEWKDAVSAVNSEVITLLENYPELAQYVSRDSSGVLTISQAGLEESVRLREEAAEKAQGASIAASVAADQAVLNSQRTDLTRNLGISDGQLINLQSAYNNNTLALDSATLAKILGVSSDDELIKTIQGSSDELLRYFSDYEKTQLGNRLLEEEIAQGYLNRQSGYDAEKQQDNNALLTAMAQTGGANSSAYQRNLARNQQKTSDQLAREYGSEFNIDPTKIVVDGDKIKIDGTEVSREALETSLASAQAMSDAAADWEKVANHLETIANSVVGGEANNLDNVVSSYNSQNNSFDFSAMGDAEFERMYGLAGEDKTFTADELGITDEYAQIVGAGTAKTMVDYFNKGIEEEYAARHAFDTRMSEWVDPETGLTRDGMKQDTGFEVSEYSPSMVTSDGVSEEQTAQILGEVENIQQLNQVYGTGLISQDGYIQGLQQIGELYPELGTEVQNLEDKYRDYNKIIGDSEASEEDKRKATEDLIEAQEELEASIFEKEWQKAAQEAKNYHEELKDGSITAEEYQQQVADVLSDVTGVTVDPQFVKDHDELIQAWIKGDKAAGSSIKAMALAASDASQEHINNIVNTAKAAGIAAYDTADEVQAAIKGLSFDVNGTADFTDIITELCEVDNQGRLTAQGMQTLADIIASVGVSQLTFEKNGQEINIDTTGLESSNPFEQLAAYVRVSKQVQTLQLGGWTIKGRVPAGATPKVDNVGSKSPSGSGGGGGGGKSYTPKTEDKIEDESDRYQDVNAHLDRLSSNLEKVANEQDRLTGKEMLDNMQQQVDLIEEQTKWHQKKLEIQQQEAAELRSELSSEYGVKFDADGYMTNYQQQHQKLVDEYNALVDQYNSTSSEEGQEKLKEKMEAAKEKLDAFNEAWGRYDELMNNEIPESMNTLEDLEDQIEDLRIEAFNAAVEAADNIKEVKDAWAEYFAFISGLHPDSPFRELIEDAEKYENTVENLTAKQEDLEKLMQWLPQYQAGGVVTSDNPFGENSAAFYEALQTAYESYIEAALAAESLYYDQINDIVDSYDDIADRIEKRMENYSRLVEQLDHYASVIETLYGEEDYDNLLAIKRENQNVLESSIQQQQKNLAMWQAELAKYNKDTQPEIWEAIHEKVVEAQEELNGLVEEAAENTAAILEMAIDKTVKEWKDTMLGGDADWMETQWELIKQNSEQYLDNVQEAYEIEKLRSKYNSLANDTMDLNIRKRINDQMEQELEYLREKDKLSEFDVNYANAKLEILQKQIALEEAQANKNQMKLRRDSQGNYSYVYAADKDDVNKAQDELMDAEFNAYEMSKENYLTNYDNYISAISAAAEQIKAINADTTLNEEEKAKRTQWIYDNLKEYLSGVAEQIGVSEQGMLESVKYLAMDSSEIVAQNYADIAAMMEENWTAALDAIGVAVSEEFDYIIHNMDKFLEDTKNKWAEFEDHTREWAENVQDIADDGTDGFRDIDDIIININNDMKQLNEETETFFSLINDDLGTIDAAVGKLGEYEKQIRELKDSSSKIVAQLQEARDTIELKNQEILDLKNQIKANQDGGGSNGDGSGGGGSNGGGSGGDGYAGTKYDKDTLIEGIAGNIWVYADWSNDPTRASSLTKKFNSTVAKEVQSYVNKGMSALKHEYKYYKNFSPDKFDTGGYTGEWGADGRLAMLHQKELVLNATDTENILTAVSAVREIVAAMKSDSLGSFLSIGRGSNIATNTGNNIQQTIEIYADFPAAESAAEIKAALEGLAQQAGQYAYRNK